MNVILSFLIAILLITFYAIILFSKINIINTINFNTIIPILYILTAFVFGMVASYVFEKISRKEFISTKIIEKNKTMMEGLSVKLSKYLSPNLYELIFTGHKEVKIETVRKKLTVFFSDIQGFTQLTDSIESETLTLFLNSYLNEMAEIALKYGGTIDKFIGDAIMIFFGDPNSKGEDEDALRCVLMAVEMQNTIAKLRDEWRKMGAGRDIHVRMGIHSGFCTVGNFGSENRLDYTIIGGNVNLAQRLETAAQEDQILISEHTYELIKDKILCRKKDKIYVKGIAHPVQTYEVIGCVGQMDKDELIAAFNGFSISINYDEVDKQKAIETLNKALKRFNRGAVIFNSLKLDFFTENPDK
ncbi:MAG: adenylate/guanylate cyclase domain-containing protein [Desulfobacterales bacterium]|nr:adenylate/guanylate cyclase domain-containing protein [Desulfobacterales bacterium]